MIFYQVYNVGELKQLTVFPERHSLYSLLTSSDVKPTYDRLVTSLLEDYTKLFTLVKGKLNNMDFQVVWLQHIRRMGEQGYSLSTYDAHPFFDGEDNTLTIHSGAVSAWSDIMVALVAFAVSYCILLWLSCDQRSSHACT